ncbi:DNA primase family protein [Rhizobium tumorigenes]|uniref:Phage/plasmid primase, P4 family n=1 Tax=Rhizobium tumorigenes TaxID=2041385 RepID=A0AAF1K6B8_9HYPH|nr:DNA primase family protein [Rhizobium tumorigenes]WFR96877.1 phage/plasmid primase, P4 family [Rhizobium tumorigenes]
MNRELDALDTEALFDRSVPAEEAPSLNYLAALSGGHVTRRGIRAFDLEGLKQKRRGFGVDELSKKDPTDWARAMLLENCRDGVAMIAFWRGQWWVWDTYWQETPIHLIRRRVYEFFDEKKFSNYDAETKDVKITRVKPDSSMVNQTIDVLCGLCAVEDDIEPFTWRGTGPNPDFLLPVRNGILNLLTSELLPHTPDFMAIGVADWDWTGKAYAPERFGGFTRSLWPVDQGERNYLQELLGWMLSGDRSLQKIVLLHGPTRAGKGTLIRLIQHLLGEQRYTPVNAAAFSSEFGFAGTVDKRLAIAGDLRIDHKVDAGAMTERLLQVSGGDTIRVGRKYIGDWRGAATARVLISVNEIPKLPDDSGALANRYAPLAFNIRFLGREDTRLDDDLRAEAEGIAKWAMVGLQRLMSRGRFAFPDSSARLIRRSQNSASPVREFVNDCCKIVSERRTPVDALYRVYIEWCADAGLKPSAKNRFGEALQNAFSEISTGRMPGPRSEKRASCYIGIEVRNDSSSPDTVS